LPENSCLVYHYLSGVTAFSLPGSFFKEFSFNVPFSTDD
jgi:hypothetical protein